MEVVKRSSETDRNNSVSRDDKDIIDIVRNTILDATSHDVHRADAMLAKTLSIHGDKFGDWGDFIKVWSSCNLCRLGHIRSSPCVGSGPLNPSLSILGEAPGPQEDKAGVPFVGPTGTLLRDTLKKIGISTEQDVYFTNVLACIPKDTKESRFRSPTPSEITACMPRLRRIYEEIMERSEVILVMGKIAYLGWRVLTDPQTDYTSMQSKIRMKDILGWQEAKSESMPMIYVTYHPSYIERQRSYNPESFKEIYQQWIFDLVAVKKYLDKKEIRNVRSI